MKIPFKKDKITSDPPTDAYDHLVDQRWVSFSFPSRNRILLLSQRSTPEDDKDVEKLGLLIRDLPRQSRKNKEKNG